jgi:hypothetical protein
MALSLRSPKAEKPSGTDADRVAQLTALTASIDALVKRDDELLKEQLAIERAGTLPTLSLDLLLVDPKKTVATKQDEFNATVAARQLLNGHLSPEPIVASAPQTRVDQIVMERAAAQIAVRLGRKKQGELRLRLSAERGAAQIKRWREMLGELEEIARDLVKRGAEVGELDFAYRRATDVSPDETGELPGGPAIDALVMAAKDFLQRGDLALALACQTMSRG